MAYKVVNSQLNASTIDILNVIRMNASYDYQQNVPIITKNTDIPKVGEIIYGTPAFANEFLNALVNRIALTVVQSATFYNPYVRLKKGMLAFGETIQDIFVSIAKVVNYDIEKTEQREAKRTLPDVRSAYYAINWRVMYPVTIEDEQLRQAFLSIDGVRDLIARIVDSVYQAAEYDEYLLFKYLLIKAVSAGKVAPIAVDLSDMDNAGIAFRGYSNELTFMKNIYNEAGVLTTTPKNRQIIFMDSHFNARYDVKVLAAAFNMSEADFSGALMLIDSWDTFDNDRWAQIMDASDGLEAVTADDLKLMADVKAVQVDENWFQVYDNMSKFTEKYFGSGLYWNYFYHVWKIVAHSPFANAIVYVDSSSEASLTSPASFSAVISDKSVSKEATLLTVMPDFEDVSFAPTDVNFVQTEALTTAGIAVQRYGAIMIPASQFATSITLQATIKGTVYNAATPISAASAVDTEITFNKAV